MAHSTNGLHKVGRSIAPSSRAGVLKADLVWIIQTVDMCWLETYLHRAFSAYRMTGEWFQLPPDAVEPIKSFRTVLCESDIPLPIRELYCGYDDRETERLKHCAAYENTRIDEQVLRLARAAAALSGNISTAEYISDVVNEAASRVLERPPIRRKPAPLKPGKRRGHY